MNFDQWILTVALRAYSDDQSVKGMVHIIFKRVRGFRHLDEGDMPRYPFPKDCIKKYVQVINEQAWAEQESDYGNIVTTGHAEYLVATQNECLCVFAYEQPVIIKEL